MTPSRAAAIAAALVGLAAPARADGFEHAARGAERTRLDDVVWPVIATCERGDDTHQRQCRQVRDRAAKALAGRTFVVEAEPEAFALGAFVAAKQVMPVVVSGCLACERGFEIDGRTWYVVAAPGKPRLEGGKPRAAALHDEARAFADEAAANAWSAAIASRRVELVVRAPKKSALKGVAQVDVVAWRVVDPCKGAVLAGASAAVPADPKACPVPARDREPRPPSAPPAKAP